MAAENAPQIPADAFPWWLRPIEEPLRIAAATEGKTLGQLTVPELLAWASVAAYGIAVGMLAGRIVGNLAAVAVRGPGAFRRG